MVRLCTLLGERLSPSLETSTAGASYCSSIWTSSVSVSFSSGRSRFLVLLSIGVVYSITSGLADSCFSMKEELNFKASLLPVALCDSSYFFSIISSFC
jgi:hypothetical protein